ncbi:electron-transferring-flavoprotein dehydrogenase [Gluconacetobacter liquefaciens]|uniref:electron transfer flavoprotein-ubiquinone oxidoreductase n=1 Tax=Gluconacetobacter liquefaciens TaxID=89584 RepID=UPI0011419315|nr:electron transfer flavoprotein-ubiquinone oxidoreductase [Gluconacetobacter liquefaciens]GBR04527.1 electron transfer flavoprotein-ubiquinone oxidoreductase [Gluconacetobacter liquefaciens NRIC 0522]GEB36015.1 electron-transferring-flavoprotein dehydrogenase [Gluconacetobacter liquefaciens]
MTCDVVIVGAGPAGLAAAIRLRQRAPELQVIVVEKGAETGAHVLSGVVMDPVGLDALLPGWRDEEDRPLRQEVVEDRFAFLTRERAFSVPEMLFPARLGNRGCFVGSLGEVTRYLAGRAEGLGVEIYTGFAATEILYDETGRVVGIATGDMGIGKDGQPTASFTPGMELRARYTLFAEGARGSLSKQVIARNGLDRDSGFQKYGIGIKEVWEVAPGKCHPGLIRHTVGWPLDRHTGGGSFVYHGADHLVTVGFVVHLDYANPTLSPFDEFQRFKTHPSMRDLLAGGRRVAYGARALTEGGWQAVPRVAFPGGALIGCAAGFMNVARIKGSHNAILSGMQAADAIVAEPDLAEPRSYEAGWRMSAIGRDLYPVRNVKPLWSRFGLAGLALGGLDMWAHALAGGSVLGTLRHRKADHASLRPRAEVTPIAYPNPDGVLTFDRLSSVYLSGVNHEENQPCHLRLADPLLPIRENLPRFGEPARLYCPAGVYEVAVAADGAASFVINAQNCVHCKTCDIKDPAQNITWTPPEGGGGPSYANM